jgi:hypothetical protein
MAPDGDTVHISVATYPDAATARSGPGGLDFRQVTQVSAGALRRFERQASRRAMEAPFVSDVLLDQDDGQAPFDRYFQATFAPAAENSFFIGGPTEACIACFGRVSVHVSPGTSPGPTQVVVVVWTTTDFGNTYPVGAYTWWSPTSVLPFRELLEEQYALLLARPEFAEGRLIRAFD